MTWDLLPFYNEDQENILADTAMIADSSYLDFKSEFGSCGALFSLKKTLDRHIIVTHAQFGGEKPFKCKIYSKCFTSNASLHHR